MDTEYEQVNKPWNELYKETTLGNKLTVNVGMEDQEVPLLPSNFLTKVRVGLSGGYITMRRIRIKIIPLVSRKAGVSGKLYLRDISDTTGRKLHCTESLDLGREIRLTMQHLDFSVSTRSDVPIVFGFEELVSPFLEGRELFSISVRWQFGLSKNCYSLPQSKWKVMYQEDALKVLKPSKKKASKTDSSV
uniref:Movement protein n=3 Tax=Tombusvirus TaxID=12141 RepID=MVP_TBSVJ|nr:RecName: Full=Movement protein; AltName: Full=p22 [Tomato bushy stunt virus (strain ja6)]AAC32733.1 22K protein [Tomato bushy stunt virus]AXY96391.1 p22 [Moroccan pepper virus]AFU91006.1 p22 protein [Tomato bushy stunt virus]UTQ50968.1 MAG: movement protein 2 [Tomato bushy stunt virus]WAK97597.1 p22 [Tomato bushy stunt virus]